MANSTRIDAAGTFAASRLEWRDYGLILVQLALLSVLVWQFHLEEKRHLCAALLLGSGGFAVHALLPAGYRHGWFVGMSVVGIALVLGFENAAWVLVIAGAMIAVAVLPIAWWWRVALLLALAALFVWQRRGSAGMFWPIVGSMFMFRLIVYMQCVRRESRPSSLLETCSYFLMLPNAFFPLFPVVDYDTFRTTYYNDERRKIYQSGVHWLTTGAAHLLVYRLIKYEFLPTPLEIRTATDVAQFLVMNYALYMRVSGHFHIVCGMLHLFGYHLPRTHDCYFLASSFSDIWRRINIYWKDFMMKTFFFPAYFQMRRGGNALGVALAVVWVFLWTWLAHSWQAFWLVGNFPLRSEDALLWLGVGLFVAVNGVFDYRRASQPVSRPGFSFVRATLYSLQVLGVFSCVCVFWAQWSNPEVLKLLFYSTYVMTITMRDVAWIGGTALLAVCAGVAVQYAMRHGTPWKLQRLSFDQSVTWHLVPLAGVLFVSQPPVYSLLGTDTAQSIAGLQAEHLSRAETLAAIAGYYEELNDNALQAGPFLGDPGAKRQVEVVDFGDMIQHRDDLLEFELIPNWQGSWHGATMTTNRWGFRDRDRSLVKPPQMTRVAFVGSSLVMGYGVNDDEPFTRLLEERWRQTEVLNFGVGRYYPIHRLAQIEHKVLPFQPDVIVYCAHQDELYTSAKRFASAYYHQLDLEAPCLGGILTQAGVNREMSEALLQGSLDRFHVDILRCVYSRMREVAQEQGASLICVYIPIPGDHDLPFDPRICLTIARDAGLRVVDLGDWWGPHAAGEVLQNDSAHHPNARGHALLAEVLAKALQAEIEARAP